jgi:integrase
MSGNVHKRGTTWSVMWDEPRGADGRRQQRKKGGFKTKKEAQVHLTQMLASLANRSYVQPDKMTVAQYLTEQWLPSLQVRESTQRSSGSRSISLDDHTVAVLRRHRARQASERLAWGPAYQDTDLVFAREDGLPLRPEYIGTLFNRLQKKVGMKHIRLHDLRHSHATLMLAQGIPAKVVSERLGHASISITLDTYSHVLPGIGEAAAQQSADAVFGQSVGRSAPTTWAAT